MPSTDTPSAAGDRAATIAALQKEHPAIYQAPSDSPERRVRRWLDIVPYCFTADLVRGRSVLDWGCNSGYGLEVLARSAADVAGLDVSPSALDAARARFAGRGVALALWNERDGPFPERTFDVVTCFQVLEHVSAYDTFFATMLSQLDANGTLVISTPNAALRLGAGDTPWNPFHYREFVAHELRDFLSRWFRQVSVLGLQTNQAIRDIELRRIRKVRAIYHQTAEFVPPEPNPVTCPPLEDAAKQACYTDTDLASCIDLVALCSAPVPV
jgi:2-polyprenyl-3-methyl-5-hydroxy-6-metoxy-1,4-benzoquinol methylase